jgi:hypothetical protein
MEGKPGQGVPCCFGLDMVEYVSQELVGWELGPGIALLTGGATFKRCSLVDSD